MVMATKTAPLSSLRRAVSKASLMLSSIAVGDGLAHVDAPVCNVIEDYRLLGYMPCMAKLAPGLSWISSSGCIATPIITAL
jgi:hypothetical protein